MVQLARGAKRKINDMVKSCPFNMNGPKKNAYLNIIPLSSYDLLIVMDWLDQHNVFLDYYNNPFNFLDEEGNLRTV